MHLQHLRIGSTCLKCRLDTKYLGKKRSRRTETDEMREFGRVVGHGADKPVTCRLPAAIHETAEDVQHEVDTVFRVRHVHLGAVESRTLARVSLLIDEAPCVNDHDEAEQDPPSDERARAPRQLRVVEEQAD